MTPPAVEVVDRTRHHIALRLLPFLFLLYIVNYVDRTYLAYAALGMSRDLGFSDEVFGLGAGIFFVTYTAMQVPGALLGLRPPEKVFLKHFHFKMFWAILSHAGLSSPPCPSAQTAPG
jgi:sugar phosphate permease